MSSDACKSMGLLLGAHLDGQLDPVKTLEVEDHVAACESCRERLALDRAIRGSLKKAVRVDAPDDLRARMLAAIASEQAEESDTTERVSEMPVLRDSAPSFTTEAPSRRPTMLRHWRTMLPIASAAALVMAWGAAGKQPVDVAAADTMVPAGLSDDLLRDFVGQHSHSLPPEQADPKQVRQFERYVGVPVRVPQFGQNAHFVGGRLVPLHGGERAAMLQYEVKQGEGTQRVTVFVYDPRKIQIGGAHLAARAIGTAEVRVGQTDGYSVAVTQHGGVGYAMASDLDADSSASLVSAVDRE
ncbi:MAG: hypothetical protein JWP97_1370 [Labilithrix sp.]|nr:hypothetical protein [Labilithrix sp.]